MLSLIEERHQLKARHIQAGMSLAALKTKNGHPRLFSADKKQRFDNDQNRKWLLTPSIPKDAVFIRRLEKTRQWILEWRKSQVDNWAALLKVKSWAELVVENWDGCHGTIRLFSEQEMELVTQFLAPYISKTWWAIDKSEVSRSHGKNHKSNPIEPQEVGTRYELRLRKLGSPKRGYPSFPMTLAQVILIYVGYR